MNSIKKYVIENSLKCSAVAITTVVLLSAGITYHNNVILDKEQVNVQVDEELKNAQHMLKKVEDENKRLSTANEMLRQENSSLKHELDSIHQEISRGKSRTLNVEVTAYTLSEASCNKGVDHPAYGRTAIGTNLAGHSLWSARTVAVDPDVIPLGSKIRLTFHDNSVEEYNGIYLAADTGGAIQGNVIDLFAGEKAENLAMKIGRRQATVEIL